MKTTFLPWVVTRKIGDEEKPIARFAFSNDAQYYVKKPKYRGRLNVTFEGNECGVTAKPAVYHAKIVSSGEFYGFLAAEEVELDPDTNRFTGLVHDHARGRTNLPKSYKELPASIFGHKVVWATGRF